MANTAKVKSVKRGQVTVRYSSEVRAVDQPAAVIVYMNDIPVVAIGASVKEQPGPDGGVLHYVEIEEVPLI